MEGGPRDNAVQDVAFKLRFFLELREKLFIPEGAIINLFPGDRLSCEVAKQRLLIADGHPIPEDRQGQAIVSLRLSHWDVDPVIRLQPVARLTLNWLLRGLGRLSNTTGERECVTLVEMIILSTSLDAEAVVMSFERCRVQLQIFLENYQSITNTVITPLHPERIRNPIPYAVAAVDQRPLWSDDGWQAGGLVEASTPGLPPQIVPDGDIDLTMLQRIQTRRSRDARGDYLARADVLRLRAHRALLIDGDFDTAVISVQSQVEVLADAVLGFLLWEEGTSVETAVGVLEDRDVPRKVAGRFQALLKGDWNAKTSVVRDWHDDLYQLRNRIVHRGYYPTLDEAIRAFRSGSNLMDHLRECLYDRRHAYPKTAMLVLGRPTFEARGTWHGKLKRVLEAEEETHPTWLENYITWRRAVEDERDRQSSTTLVTKS